MYTIIFLVGIVLLCFLATVLATQDLLGITKALCACIISRSWHGQNSRPRCNKHLRQPCTASPCPIPLSWANSTRLSETFYPRCSARTFCTCRFWKLYRLVLEFSRVVDPVERKLCNKVFRWLWSNKIEYLLAHYLWAVIELGIRVKRPLLHTLFFIRVYFMRISSPKFAKF